MSASKPHWRSFAAMPTLLGLVIFLLGLSLYGYTRPSLAAPPAVIAPTPVGAVQHKVVLSWERQGQKAQRTVMIQASTLPAERLQRSLRALKAWLEPLGAWPKTLSAPDVFALSGRAFALSFRYQEGQRLSISDELSLLNSLRATARAQGAEGLYVLVNGRVPKTFLGSVQVPQRLP